MRPCARTIISRELDRASERTRYSGHIAIRQELIATNDLCSHNLRLISRRHPLFTTACGLWPGARVIGGYALLRIAATNMQEDRWVHVGDEFNR